jgi:hypothetical protein
VRGTLVLAVLLAAMLPASAADFGLESLFGALSAKKPQRTTFHERKFMALLDRPVESRGELTFTPPDRMEKRTTFPKAERVVVDRERITLERGGRTYGMGLRENPGVAVLVESIRATLAGDLAALTRTYSAALDGTRAKWRLVLRPLDPSVATLVERIEIGGANDDVRTVEIFQADGDRSLMTITPGTG